MSRTWLDSEEGCEAILDLSNQPEVKKFIEEVATKHNGEIIRRLLDLNLVDSKQDRQMLIERSKLDGAKSFLNSLLGMLSDAGKSKEGGLNARSRKQGK